MKKEEPSKNEHVYTTDQRVATQLLRLSDRHYRDALLVAVPAEITTHQPLAEEMARQLSQREPERRVLVASAEEIIANPKSIPRYLRSGEQPVTLIVTDYGPGILQGQPFDDSRGGDAGGNGTPENKLQNLVRSAVANDAISRLIVLSRDVPDIRAFGQGYYWINGPFEPRHMGIWQLQSGEGSQLTLQNLHIGADARLQVFWEAVGDAQKIK